METSLAKLIRLYPETFIDSILRGFETDRIHPHHPQSVELALDAAVELCRAYDVPLRVQGEVLYKRARDLAYAGKTEQFIKACEEAVAFNEALPPEEDTSFGICNIKTWLASGYLELGLNAPAAVLLTEALDYQAEHPDYHRGDDCLGWSALEHYEQATGEKLPNWEMQFNRSMTLEAWAEEWKAYRNAIALQTGGGI